MPRLRLLLVIAMLGALTLSAACSDSSDTERVEELEATIEALRALTAPHEIPATVQEPQAVATSLDVGTEAASVLLATCHEDLTADGFESTEAGALVGSIVSVDNGESRSIEVMQYQVLEVIEDDLSAADVTNGVQWKGTAELAWIYRHGPGQWTDDRQLVELVKQNDTWERELSFLLEVPDVPYLDYHLCTSALSFD